MEALRYIQWKDKQWSQRLWAKDFGKPINYFIYFLSCIFMEETAVVMIFLSFFIFGRSLQLFIVYLITFVACIVVTLGVKKLTRRARPTPKDFPKTTKSMFFRNKQSNNSMPSGDTLQAANLAWFIYLFVGTPWQYIFILIAVMVAYSRVYLCCHFISDTLVGAILAITTTQIVIGLGAAKPDYWGIIQKITS